MDWSDDGIVLSTRTLGETAVILEVLTRAHGRHLGLVRGGTSRRSRPVLQAGNRVSLTWRARLAEHLGSFAPELANARAGHILESRAGLAGLNAITHMLRAVLPEHESHPPLFDATEILLDALGDDTAHWGPLYVRWEAGLLEALGFGLDLSACAATGETGDLTFVSPRTGRAVGAIPGAPYAGKLLPLPGFLVPARGGLDPDGQTDTGDLAAGLRLTGWFLADRVLAPHGRDMPPARAQLAAILIRESD